MAVRPRIVSMLAARDPGRARLAVALAVAAGALASALAGMAIIKAFHADGGLLAMALFLSVMAGSMVQDRSATGRVITTALMIPTLLLAVAIATLLTSTRPAVIGVFIALSGLAIWIRRFGPRAGALGSLGFMSYFFTLFMKPTMEELPVFCLVGACAVATQLVARSLLLLRRPRARIEVLLKELRAASGESLRVASRSEHPDALRAALARLDDVGRAITAWQQHFPTERYIACDEDALAGRALDARVDTEEACYELAKSSASATSSSADAFAQLEVILDEHASASRIAAATTWAEGVLARRDRERDGDFAVYLIARSAIAHARVRGIDLSRGLVRDGRRVNAAESRSAHPRTRRRLALRWMPWKQWSATSRMAVQAMIAASIAVVVGEAISASRWYWAVMTAFVIFIGATTRSGILTRAYRRVIGTALGIVVGIVPVMLADHNTAVLSAICVIGVFCMLYFGPLNYAYSAFSLTVMLVALYGLLGVLDPSILELRIVETFSGAAIGVICAYVIASTNSRPVLVGKATAYLDALDDVLRSVSSSFGGTERSSRLLSDLDALEAAQSDADRAVSGMAAAFRINRSQLETMSVHLMFITTRAAARLTQSIVTPESSTASATRVASRHVIDEAIATVQESVADARRAVGEASAGQRHDDDRSAVVLALDRLPDGASTAASAAIMALARIDWALRRFSDGGERDGSRRSAAPPVALEEGNRA